MEAKKRFKNPLALSVIGFSSFIHTACKQKDRPFHQKLRFYLIWKWTCLSKDRPFYQRTEFSLKFRVFFKTSVFLKIPRSKDRPFLPKDGVFIKIPCFFKTSVFLKIPRSKDRPFYQRTEFSLKVDFFNEIRFVNINMWISPIL